MSATLKLFTSGPMRRAAILSSSGDATGYPKEWCADLNPSTYWKSSTGSGTITLDFDLQVATKVEAAILVVRNYDTASAGSITIRYGASSPAASSVTGTTSLLDYDTPLRIKTTNFPTSSYRYWGVSLTGTSGVAPQIAMVLFCKAWTFDTGAEWPESDGRVAFNQHLTGGYGQRYTHIGMSQTAQTISRNYKFFDATDKGYVSSAFADARGSALPCVVWESSTQSEAVLCRFASDTLPPVQQIDYGYWSATLAFTGIPWIPAGEYY